MVFATMLNYSAADKQPNSLIHSFIMRISVAPLQGDYTGALQFQNG